MLFVYGTLRRHEDNPFARMLRDSARFVGRGTVNGRLRRLADYTGLILSGAPGEPIAGEVFSLAECEQLWPVLDRYEGREFRRETVSVLMEDGEVLSAAAYVYRGD